MEKPGQQQRHPKPNPVRAIRSETEATVLLPDESKTAAFSSSVSAFRGQQRPKDQPLSQIENRLGAISLRGGQASPSGGSGSGYRAPILRSGLSIRTNSALGKRLDLSSSSTRKRLDLSTGRSDLRNTRQRSPLSRPAFKLSASLVQTYIKINETYFSQQSQMRMRKNRISSSGNRSENPSQKLRDDANDDYIICVGAALGPDYIIIKILGKGSFGQVVEAERTADGTRHAIKIVKNRKLHHSMARTELKILKMILENDQSDSCNIGIFCVN